MKVFWQHFLCATFAVLLATIPAFAQPISTAPQAISIAPQSISTAPQARYYIGASVHPLSTIVTQVNALARIPTARHNQYVIGAASIGMVFYSRDLQHEIGAFNDKAAYATISGGVGFGAFALTVGIGARPEHRLRAESGDETFMSWMHTFSADVFVSDDIGVRVEYLGPRWLLVGVDIAL
jgi:hypothetical protein